ncbi:MAG TPA: DNA-directed RNA polymerase subunit A', partial [Thermoplasmatales archaeon]|nr:DNA-directed RNA polymerase subunit A' [Thermoplasmatales archaeon]
ARTVISPDPNLSINEVGVPIEMARELTVPVKVTSHNLNWCKEMVRRGPNPVSDRGEYIPGVNYIIRERGGIRQRIKVTKKNAQDLAEKLEEGMIIERQLMDGDIVLFNRQPSLHRMSMMAHKVKVVPYKTFRFNLSVCPPYNADFDGDEMNLHVLQGEEARAEAEILLKVQEHILSPRFGGPIIGAIHDHITGCFLLTFGDKKVPLEDATRILSNIPEKEKLPKVHTDENGKKFVYGKDIFSSILPKDLTISFPAKVCSHPPCDPKDCPTKTCVIIEKGVLKQGVIDENAIGAFKGVIIDRIVRDHGSEGGRKFLDQVTRMGIAAISLFGFTVGIDEEDIPVEARRQIEEGIEKAKEKINHLIEVYRRGELEPLPGRSLEETLEMEIMRVTGRARDMAGEIASRHLGLNNSSVIMARSGARGSMLNLSQMAGCVGQQAVRGERIHRGYRNRTLPHFKKGDIGAEAKGFVASSYKKGLTPTEYFFHSMGGREGLVDTAVRTSRSGYMQRRLINALENLKVEYDVTVRDTDGVIIQFVYGEDGVDPAKSVGGKAIDVNKIVVEVEEGR